MAVIPPRLRVMGGNGRLGRALVSAWATEGFQTSAWTRQEVNLEEPNQVEQTVQEAEFDVLINAAGIVDVDGCETAGLELDRVNVQSPACMSAVCKAKGAKFIHLSTDYVFSGDDPGPLSEAHLTEPCSAYGASKLESERAVLSANPEALVVRVSWLFGGHKPSFPDRVLAEARKNEFVYAVNDKWSCPTYAEDLCGWLLQWLRLPEWQGGVLHLCNSGAASWSEYGQHVLDLADAMGLPLKARQITGHSMVGFDRFIAKRPVHTVMSTERFTRRVGMAPRSWQSALEHHMRRSLMG